MIPEKLRAAAVIARRDFVAVIFSKTFLLFLLGPLFPLVVGGMAGAIGAQVDKELNQPQVGLALPAEQTRRLLAAHAALADALPGDVPDFVALDAHDTNPRALLAKHLPGTKACCPPSSRARSITRCSPPRPSGHTCGRA
jgi:ABC-2 type transport system permease protein